MVANPEKYEFIEGVRSLPASEKFDVKIGLPFGVTEEERKLEDKHADLEEALRVLLMPERLFAEESMLQVVKEEMSKEMEMLGFETESSVGWVTMEGEGGEVTFETGTILFVK